MTSPNRVGESPDTISGTLYDLLHSESKPYESEAFAVAEIIRAENPTARRLLDVACGTGEHLSYLSESFFVTGLDNDAAMLDVAHKKVGAATFHHGDMRSFDLDERFDAVTCLFSSIGYLDTVDDLDAAIANMARHLSPGGVLVVEPWHHTNVWRDVHTFAGAINTAQCSVSRTMIVTVDDQTSVLDMHVSVADRHGLRSFDEQHRLRLFSVQDYRQACEATGLVVQHDQAGLSGRGLFVGVNTALG